MSQLLAYLSIEKTTVGGLTGLMYYANNEDDPYITLKDEVGGV